ncbi:hypothetical protein BBP40_002330 [Aspergillus hancockii]|nr:hypothetical protein BBP40_002330 [Aspergillus hancockii]
MDEIIWARQVAAQTTPLATTTPVSQAPTSANTGTSPVSSPLANPTSTTPQTSSNPGSSSVPNATSNSFGTSSIANSTTSALQTSSSSEASSVASASSTSDVQHASSGLSGGGLAGAIVGSIVGTFILTLLGAFVFFRRRRQNKSRAETTGLASPDTSKGPGQIYSQPIHSSLPSVKGAQLPHLIPVGAQYLSLSSYIPQPADDGTVSSRIQTLFDQASLHVDNYYSSNPTRLRSSQDAVAGIDNYDSAFLPAPLAIILSNSRGQRAVITHVLVRTLLQAIQPGRPTESLLPAPYASGPQLNTDNDQDCAIFAWRMLTAYLHKAGRSAQEITTTTPPEDAIRKLAEDFSTAFAPYSDSQFPDSDRLAQLTSVLRAASDLGTWLFSQPCTFDFRWDTSSVPPDHVIVLPAVVKISDETGQRLLVPQVLVEKSVAQV